MKLLAIESSCEVVTVAACDGGRLEQYPVHGGRNASETIVPEIMRLLADMDLSLTALDAIVLGTGPGAFTGLRLGCSVAQGLALTSDQPILPICSLEAIALDQHRPRVLVATDARMNETYHAAYECADGEVRPVAEPACLPPEQVELPDAGPWWGAGSAFAAYPARLLVDAPALSGRVGGALAQASALIRLARRRGLGEAVDASRVGPLYVRDKVALTTAERLARGGRS